jgi:sulfite reductase (ferredoxin)
MAALPSVSLPATPAVPRDDGQWALGDRAPLNANERLKREDDGLNVRERILGRYAAEGFAAIDPDDLRGRLRWWGLYTQRRPGIDGGKTGVLEPHELDDEYFMLRIRIDGGRLTTAQLRAIAEVSTRYARDTADLTDRQNVQLHWIRIEDVPAIWRLLESVGLSSQEACGDTPRVILGSPVAGVAADEIVDGTPAIEEIARRFVGNPELSNLPRKFKTAISGSPRQDVVPEVNDISFVGVFGYDGRPGFDLWVGGGLSTNPKLAVRLGVFVPLAEVPDVWAAVAGLFRDYGYRRLRHRARLKFLVADWGPERFRDVMEREYLGRQLADGPAPPRPEGPRDHVGVHPQRDGAFFVGVAPRVGRLSGVTLAALAELIESHGSTRIRTTADQKLVILDVAEDQVSSLVAGLALLDLPTDASSVRRGAMACTGIEFCKLAIVETKKAAADLIDELEHRLPNDVLSGIPIGIHVNGCPNSCARIQVADIGLKGMLVPGPDGQQVAGFQVHLGGSLGAAAASGAGFGRKPRGLKVAATELGDYVTRVVERFAEQRDDGERLADWMVRASEGDLR